MKKTVISIAVLFLFVAAAFAIRAFFFAPKQPVSWLTEPVQRGNIEQSVSATGDIAPALLVDVGAQASGQIKKFYVKLGQQVKKGELIAEIDAATQQNDLDTSRAQLASYQAQLASKKVSLAMAQKDYARERDLWKKKATSQKDYDTATETLASAKSAITELESSIRIAEISVSTAETDLGYTRITAPMDGTIVSTSIEEGQTVNSSQSTPTIVQIADLSKMVIRMQVAEGDITRIQPGMTIHFTTLANPDTPRDAVFSSIDPGLTTMSQGSYTTSTDLTSSAIYYYARALVDNSDNSLRIGMTTENTIVVAHAENELIIPTLAISSKKGKKFVTVLQQGKPQEREITTGISDSANTVVLSGLKEGEEVVTGRSDSSVNSIMPRGMGRKM